MAVELVDVLGPAAVAITVFLFAVTYARLPWWSTRWGRSIMIMAAAMFGLAVTTIALRVDVYADADLTWLHGWPRILAWWVVAGVYVWKTWVAYHATKGPRDE